MCKVHAVAVITTLASILLIKSDAASLETRRHCCGLGTNYANSLLDCNSFQPPIAGIDKEDELTCVQSIKICCRKQNEQLECNKGIDDEKVNGTCEQIGGTRNDCCDACQSGANAGKAKQPCDEELGLGSPFDQAFTSCCNDIALTTSTTKATTTTNKPTSEEISDTSTSNELSPLPPLENVCDIGDICAQICIPTGDSYRCDCNKGFKLMADGISCKPDNSKTPKKQDNCAVNNPCDHNCVDTGVAIKCSCKDGFELAKDKRTCVDIDECKLNIYECDPGEVCVNDDGGYFCDDPNFLESVELNTDPPILDKICPPGYKYNFENLVCDDIDECQFTIICPRPKTCINTIGSFKCEGKDEPQCPPGFHYKPAIDTCADIDECVTGDNDCNKESQSCLNTKGNYTCIDNVSKRTCPPGFKKNSATNNCEDINECEENDKLCGENEECVNEPGGHTCEPRQTPVKNKPFYPLPPPYVPKLPPKPTDVSSLSSTTSRSSTTTTTAKSTTLARRASCASGYKYSQKLNTCDDIDECEADDICDSTQDCYNVIGSYVCNCKVGFAKDYQTGACMDLNECQLGSHDCTEAQRCDNTIGSYLCARMTGCGTGYTLNYANGVCEDDDECALRTDNCHSLGPNFKCRNTLGSYRCESVRIVPPPVRPPFHLQPSPPQLQPFPSIPVQQIPQVVRPQPPTVYRPEVPTPKPIYRPDIPSPRPTIYRPDNPTPRPTISNINNNNNNNYPLISGTLKRCLPGYEMNEQGRCEDIDECKSNPCERGQNCVNFNGRYQCISALQCKIGFELDKTGQTCIDVDECSRGTHKCKPSQICKNGRGFYTCECPSGHHMDPIIQQCVDLDECKYYKACGDNAKCTNTIGSYQCECNPGFKGLHCPDIDECQESQQLCEHNCINLWGSYRCACNPGFILNYDNRTCTDIDECSKFKDKKLCVGICENVPGSYRCKCPNGYRLGADGRTCKDIDECKQNVCSRPDDICLNTNGGYKCYPIVCPSNYFRDPQHKGRCKRPVNLCDVRDTACIQMPEQYTYHYITLVSKLLVKPEGVQFFQINGPKWAIATAEFSMEIVNVYCPHRVEKVDESWFRIVTQEFNTMQLFLIRSIEGPQEIELRVNMKLFQGSVMTGTVVAHIFILVSEYTF